MKRSLSLALLLICLLAYPVQAQTATPIPVNLRANLTACYTLDEASGTRYDSIGSFDLTDNNTVLRSGGKINQGATLVAANSEYLSIADNPEFSSTSSFTIALWFKPTGATPATRGLFSKYASATNGEYFCNIIVTTGRVYCGATNNTAATTFNTDTYASVDNWYFLVFSYDYAAKYLYASVNAGTQFSKSLGYNMVDTSTALYIGRYLTYYGQDVIDTLSFWKGRVLNASERYWLYNGGYGRSCADILGHGATATETPTSTAVPTATSTALANYASTLSNGTRIEIERSISYGQIIVMAAGGLFVTFYLITWLFRYLWTAGKRTT